jgi:hypothetical protein
MVIYIKIYFIFDITVQKPTRSRIVPIKKHFIKNTMLR